jgi:hypothetical protein
LGSGSPRSIALVLGVLLPTASSFTLRDTGWQEKAFLQGLKPRDFSEACGTTEVVPS